MSDNNNNDNVSDQKREEAIKQYEIDIVNQKKSGPWDFSAEQVEINRKVFAMVTDIIPFDDIHKFSDCDLIYRFLIAKRWKPEETANALRENMAFRKKEKLNEIVWEKFPEELEKLYTFQGVDKNNLPIFYNRPDPAFVSEMTKKYDKEYLMRYNVKVIEMGRRISFSLGCDRISSIVDMSQLGLSIVRNMSAMSLMKATSTVIQTNYPENLLYMLCQNGGYTFSAIWAVLRPFLDERVQKKIQNVGSGEGMKTEMEKWVDLKTIPQTYGGVGAEKLPKFKVIAELDSLEKGTPPHFKFGEYKNCPFADQ